MMAHREHKSPTRVLHIIDSLGLGGAQTSLLQICRGLDQSRYEVIVAALRNRPSLVEGSIRESGVQIIHLNGRRSDPLVLFKMVVRLRRVIRDLRPDIVHIHLQVSKVCGRIALLLQVHTPIVVTHERSFHRKMGRFPFKQIDRWLTRHTDAGIANSRATQAAFSQITQKPLSHYRVIYNAVDIDKFAPAGGRESTRRSLGLKDGDFAIGFVGRLHEVKNPLLLLHAVQIALHERDDLHLYFVGDGPLRARLDGEIARMGLSDRCHLLGMRSDVPLLLDAFDVFVMPSNIETFGIAVVEAMASRTPVIASAVGGIPEIITSGEDGLLVTPGDTQGFADAILRIAGDESLARRLVDHGWQTVNERFTVQVMVQQIQALYVELLSRA